MVNAHFKKQFMVDTQEELAPFDGPPRPLDKRITVEEVKVNAKKLKNNRAADHKQITAELVKYGPDELYEMIMTVLNNIFEKHEDVDTGSGILTPTNKPNKPKSLVTNLRETTLLPMIR